VVVVVVVVVGVVGGDVVVVVVDGGGTYTRMYITCTYTHTYIHTHVHTRTLGSSPPVGMRPCVCAYPVANRAIHPAMACRPFHRSALVEGPRPREAWAGYLVLKSSTARSKRERPARACGLGVWVCGFIVVLWGG
jgi:hypothetical protein